MGNDNSVLKASVTEYVKLKQEWVADHGTPSYSARDADDNWIHREGVESKLSEKRKQIVASASATVREALDAFDAAAEKEARVKSSTSWAYTARDLDDVYDEQDYAISQTRKAIERLNGTL